MRVNIIPSQTLLPQSAVKLGRFVTNVEHPHQHHHDPQSTIPPSTLASARSAYTSEHQTASTTGFRSALTSLMSARFSKGTRLKVRVTTEQLKRYVLDNSEAWFDEATHIPATRAWIERSLDRGHDIFMIVGFHTVTDASIRHESMAIASACGHAEVPVSLSLAAVGVVAPLGGITNPSTSLQKDGLDGERARFIAPGEQVCAIEYRKIRHKWLSSKRIEKCQLSDVRQWPSMERARDEEDGEDDIIEVELEDVGDLDGHWDKQILDHEVVLIRR